MSKFWTVIHSVLAGGCVYTGISHLMDYSTVKAAVLQKYLADSPELTDKVIKAATETVDQLAGGSYLYGFVTLGLAGLLTGLALIEANKKE